ncbi:ABC transporter permease [Intestinibacillus massiliensis]|uniref:ABC transporter permease n=1 Tax=Intestinibacillus massiliensis TaxID=1871029 RepID=UPI000B357453|nr:ABC transporter permease [Intestinibacillus massiliensis]
MKRYLDLVPVAARAHRRQNRMSVFCIVLSVLLVTAIFGMADMFLRSQKIQSYKTDGNWHANFQNISDTDAAMIAARPDVAAMSWYDAVNYKAEPTYSINGKTVAICGFDEDFLSDIYIDTALTEGHFPTGGQEAVLTQNAKETLGLRLGDTVTVNMPEGRTLPLAVCGFADNTAMMLRYDCVGVFLSTGQFRAIPWADAEGAAANPGMYYVQFTPYCNIQKAIADIQSQLQIPDAQVGQNVRLLGVMGQSGDPMMLCLYATAGVLFVLVLLAGIMMIASSLNSNVAQRTQFFGMLRCIGATPKQVIRLVRCEALSWCQFAIPLGVGIGVVLIWVLCAVLRALSPYFFAEMPVIAVSVPSIAAGVVVGLLTVLLAARAPARRAARVSPLTAVSGNADAAAPARHAVGAKRLHVDTALGIHHAMASRKNFALMVGSFALSIVLFLSFSALISFMDHAVTPLNPATPDLSIISADNTRSVRGGLLETLGENPAVARVYGRMFAFDVPAVTGGQAGTADLISYDAPQFRWAEKALLEGSVQETERGTDAVLTVYSPENPFRVGDTVTLDCNGASHTLRVTGMLSDSPFSSGNGFGDLICSEGTFRRLMGDGGYTVIDMQLTGRATDADVQAIRALAGEGVRFSDRRAGNAEATGAYLAFALFVYGFLALIALITVCNIINSLAMSVSAWMRQYGAMRAVGMGGHQLVRMVTAEAAAYAVAGSVAGCILGLPLHRFLFEKMVSFRWGDPWQAPLGALALIVAIVAVTSFAAVRGPAKRIRELSIADTISAE